MLQKTLFFKQLSRSLPKGFHDLREMLFPLSPQNSPEGADEFTCVGI